ncbi:MAG TPA: hypothetical protein IAA58_06410 [Candidatus Gallacutalibacter stercoravium]|nr:hypothetical protein [Candidatus Gallacutalibacter stercoravium]
MCKGKAMLSAVLAGAVCLLACAGCGGQEQQSLNTQGLDIPQEGNYQTVEVARQDFTESYSVTAQRAYPVQSSLYFTKENARLESFAVSKGQTVKAGDVLATFTVEGDAAALEEARLKLERTQEEFELGKTQRQEALAQGQQALTGLTGQEAALQQLKNQRMQAEYDQYVSRTEYDIANQQRQVADLQEDVGVNQLTAPFDGVILSVASVKEGSRVDPSEAMVKLYASGQMLLQVDDPQRLTYNMPVQVTLGDDSTVAGRVVAATNLLPKTVTDGAVYIALEEEVDPIQINGARVSFDTFAQNGVLVLARDAVHNEDSGGYYVNILQDSMVQKRYILAGHISQNGVWVMDGLQEGQQVILK